MVWDIANTTIQVAKKEYRCEAFEWINNSDLGEDDFDSSDWIKIQQDAADGGKILPGMRYIKTKGKWEGDWSVFRARYELYEICHKYHIYHED